MKFTTYKRAHDKIVGNATYEQMRRENYGNTIAVEHVGLLKKLEDSDQKLKLKRKALDRAAEDADREALGTSMLGRPLPVATNASCPYATSLPT